LFDPWSDSGALEFSAKINASDNPRWNEAMNGGYWEAMKIEIATAIKLAWIMVPLNENMNVLNYI